MKYIFLVIVAHCIMVNSYSQMDSRFYYPNRAMDDLGMLKYEKVALRAEQDTITAIFVKPETKQIKASVFYIHGAGGNVTRYVKFIEPLVREGYQVFMVDFRGYGNSTGTPTHVNIAADAQIFWNYFTGRDDVKKTKLIVYGASMGSQVAVNLTRKNQDKVEGLILDGGLSSMVDMAAWSSPEAQRNMIRQMLKVPYEAKEEIKYIKEVKLLFIHSREDKSVPFEQGELVYSNAIAPKYMWIYEGEHLAAPLTNEKEFLKQVNKLLQ